MDEPRLLPPGYSTIHHTSTVRNRTSGNYLDINKSTLFYSWTLTEVRAFLSFMLFSVLPPNLLLKKAIFLSEDLARASSQTSWKVCRQVSSMSFACSRSFSRFLFGCDLFPVKPHGPPTKPLPKGADGRMKVEQTQAVTESTEGSASLGLPSAQAWRPGAGI